MANNGFPQANGGFPQSSQQNRQGFPQGAQQGYGWGNQQSGKGTAQHDAQSNTGWGNQQKSQEGMRKSAQSDSQQGIQGDDFQQDAQQDSPRGIPQDTQGFDNASREGYFQRPQSQSAFSRDNQATTVLPPMRQMVDTTNQSYWTNQQNPVAPQPVTYQASLPVNPKAGILYKNTGRKLEEIPDPTPIILETTSGKMMLTLDTVSIYRLGDAAKRHKNYYVELPLKSLSSASVVSNTDGDGNVTSAICLDVVTIEGHNQVPATAAEALKDVWSFEVTNIAEAQSFCDKVNSRINNERFPVRDMPHIDEGPRNTAIAAVIAGILAVALAVVCFTGHPYSKSSYELSPEEYSRIQKEAMDKAQKEAEDKVAADQAKKQEEQQKQDQENQKKQEEQQTQQQNAERDAAKQTAQRILATDTLSKQGLINKMVAQGITQDLAKSTADGLTDVNWSANATDLAKKYLQAHPDWTADQLRNQLVNNDLFTQDEANTATGALAGDIAKNQAAQKSQSAPSSQDSSSPASNDESGKDKSKDNGKNKSGILNDLSNWFTGSDNK